MEIISLKQKLQLTIKNIVIALKKCIVLQKVLIINERRDHLNIESDKNIVVAQNDLLTNLRNNIASNKIFQPKAQKKILANHILIRDFYP